MTSIRPSPRGLDGYGYIREGAEANLVLFNPQTVGDTATYENPQSLSVGIEKVWVNGSLAYNNKINGGSVLSMAGKIIKRNHE